MMKKVSGVWFAAGIAAAAYLVLPQEVFSNIVIGFELPPEKPHLSLLNTVEVALSLAASTAAIVLIRAKRPVWMTYLFVFASFMLLFWSVVNPVRSMKRGKEELSRGILSALAAAEIEWCTEENKDFTRFKASLAHQFRILDILGINYSRAVYGQYGMR